MVEPGLFWDPLLDREHDEPLEDPEQEEPSEEWLESDFESSISLLFSWFSPLTSGYTVCD